MDIGALGRFEPSLTAVKIPRCASCGTANPQAAPHCPRCGAAVPPAVCVRQETSIVARLEDFAPWHARLLLKLGDCLRRLAERIKGETQ